MLIIGIDPGISGSICFLDNGKILDVIEMPIMTDGKKNKKQVNGSQVYNEITKRIMNVADNICDGRIVSILEGGYDLNALKESAYEHVKALIEN